MKSKVTEKPKGLDEAADVIGKSIGIGIRDALLQLLEHQEIASSFSFKFEKVSIPTADVGRLFIEEIVVEVTV